MALRVFITWIVFTLQISAQNLVVVYDSYKKVPDALLRSNPRFELLRSELTNERVKYRYSLRIAPGKSLFTLDSVYVERLSRLQSVIGYEQIYKNYGKDLWLRVSGRYKEGYGYQRKISEMLEERPYQWKRTGKEKQILGFRCVEVVSEKRRAYYAVDIPIPDGPGKDVFGLPGLVLEYHYPSRSYVAVALSNPEDLQIQRPEVIPVTEESKILLPLDAYRGLPPSRAIILDQNTSLRQWIKFGDD